ncbi:hypothetical protein E3E23_07050 [Thermococcus sp. CX2]|uniref:hypothetical protein n=1 Tax=Thermococcus sp. CX2 TaxID=163006 RepID=UPI00143A04D6|nr:hypothetical protein [Thermococcus sp. CX2]NJE85580.1 hypothetical protein [Thermococcus sp. CX2]
MRRGQLLSFDAMLSLVIVILMLGAITSTSSALKDDITAMLGWYERANLADNMLDLLTKSPGEPSNWVLEPSNAEVVGLRKNNSMYPLDYDKLIALNESKEALKSILAKMVNDKDVLLEGYLSEFRVGISGDFPKIYLYNKTFENPKDNPPGINFRITGDPNGNNVFVVTYIEIRRGGNTYINESICDLKRGNNINLVEGDYIKFITGQTVYLTAKRGQYTENYVIPSNAIVEMYITGPEVSNFQLNFGGQGGECPYSFKFVGIGNVVITVSAYDNSRPGIWANYTTYDELVEKNEPTYMFAVIDKEIVTDPDEIKSSKERSQWIEVAHRVAIVSRIHYNLLAGPSTTMPLIYGELKYQIPESGIFTISAPDDIGSVEFVIMSGSRLAGLKVYRNESNEGLKAVLVYKNGSIKMYSGNLSVSIPLKDLYEIQEGEVIGLWMYSLSGWSRDSLHVTITPSLEPFLDPKFDTFLMRVEVWDDWGGET